MRMSREELFSYPSYVQNLVERLNEIRERAPEHLEASKLRSKRICDRKCNEVSFAPNDLVYVQKEPRLGKFGPHYVGLNEICEITEQNNAILISHEAEKFLKDFNKLKHAYTGREPPWGNLGLVTGSGSQNTDG